MNHSRFSICRNILRAVVGLFCFAFGSYLVLQANIGVDPWTALNMGISETFGVKYGTASIAVSLSVLAADLLLREAIGVGMFLDAILVGKFVDLFLWLNLVPKQQSWPLGVLIMTVGMLTTQSAQVLYMGAGLGCGPRDALMVGLGKRFPKIPIGAVLAMILIPVTIVAWLLGGSIGIGTLYSTLCSGPMTQAVFKFFRFDPTGIPHQDILTSGKILLSGQGEQN